LLKFHLLGKRIFVGCGFRDEGKSLARIPRGFPLWGQLAGLFVF
jgi:hypothetical protein